MFVHRRLYWIDPVYFRSYPTLNTGNDDLLYFHVWYSASNTVHIDLKHRMEIRIIIRSITRQWDSWIIFIYLCSCAYSIFSYHSLDTIKLTITHVRIIPTVDLNWPSRKIKFRKFNCREIYLSTIDRVVRTIRYLITTPVRSWNDFN